MSFKGIGFKSFNNLTATFNEINVAFDNTLIALFSKIAPNNIVLTRVVIPSAPVMTRVAKPSAPVYSRI